jgi:hypothetical protein
VPLLPEIAPRTIPRGPRGRLAGTGEFREHIDYAVLIDSFRCTQWVTYVGDPYNDKYSSARTL